MRSIAIVIIASLLMSTSASAQEASAWRDVAATIPLGSKVKIQTFEGRNISGTLMRVDGAALVVKRNTRRPEPALTIPFDDVSRLERQHDGGGSSFGKALGIAAATGAGIVLSLFLLALSYD